VTEAEAERVLEDTKIMSFQRWIILSGTGAETEAVVAGTRGVGVTARFRIPHVEGTGEGFTGRGRGAANALEILGLALMHCLGVPVSISELPRTVHLAASMYRWREIPARSVASLVTSTWIWCCASEAAMRFSSEDRAYSGRR
jgi:hypothetical protein